MFIYIHLPFCLSHCVYCDFYVELKATGDRRRAYLDALKTEIRHHLSNRGDLSPIQSIYMGGGTPALFPAAEIEEILHTLFQAAPLAPGAEVTLEANPNDTASALGAYRAIGVNRLSIGVQSMQPNELKRLSRVHSADDAVGLVHKAREAGFDNLSLDLMYGIPEQTPDSWQNTLERIAALKPEHISMYGLQLEEGTRLQQLVHSGRMALPDEDTHVDLYFQGLTYLESQGLMPYEISNLATPGRESRHNLNYWDNGPFWGFGVSAHGYMDGIRYENAGNLAAYLADPARREEEHHCLPQEQLENALIFGLRKRSGVSIPELETRYQFNFESRYGQALQKYRDGGLLIEEQGIIKLAPEALAVSNEILSLFIEV